MSTMPARTQYRFALGMLLAIGVSLGWSLSARAYPGEELAKQAAIDMPQARSLALEARPGKITWGNCGAEHGPS